MSSFDVPRAGESPDRDHASTDPGDRQPCEIGLRAIAGHHRQADCRRAFLLRSITKRQAVGTSALSSFSRAYIHARGRSGSMRGLFASGLGLNDCDSALETMHGHGVPMAGEMVSQHATYRTRIGKDLASTLRRSFLRTYALTMDGHAGTIPPSIELCVFF